MKSAYQVLTTYTGDFEELLTKLALLDIFKPVIESFDAPTARKVIRYIAYLYSKDSDLILAKEDLNRKKKRCAKAAELPEQLAAQVMFLQPADEYDSIPSTIRQVAIKYLDYQDEPNNKDLKSLEDLYDEMVNKASMVPVADKDFETKYNCRKYANEIRLWIEQAHQKIKDEDTQVRAMRQELREKSKTRSQAIRPENAAGLYEQKQNV